MIGDSKNRLIFSCITLMRSHWVSHSVYITLNQFLDFFFLLPSAQKWMKDCLKKYQTNHSCFLFLNIELNYCALLHSCCRYSESRRWWFGKFRNYFASVPAVFCVCVRTPFKTCLIYSSLKICSPSFLSFCWHQVHIYKYLQILSRSLGNNYFPLLTYW